MNKDGDLIVYTNRGRPTEKQSKLKNCPKLLRAKLRKLKKEMGYADGTEILLALGIATDKMARHVHMFPEVFFMDVTCKLNYQKRDLFVMVVKDASGEAFPGNITMVQAGYPIAWNYTVMTHVKWIFEQK